MKKNWPARSSGDEATMRAFELHRAGKIAEAEKVYHQVLVQQPNNPNALHLLGVIAFQTGRLDEAIACIQKALAVTPNAAEFHLNLGNAFRGKGLLAEAIASYRQAIGLKPRYARALSNLANALYDAGSVDEAIAAYRQALQIAPNLAETHDNLGIALREKGQLNEAAAAFGYAIRLQPHVAKYHSNLGNALRDQGAMEVAISAYQQALRLEPNNATFHNNLGIAQRESGDLDNAVASFRKALALQPDYSDAHNNLGIALRDQGLIDESIAECRQSVGLNPGSANFQSNLILIMHYSSQSTPQSLLAEARNWARAHADPLKPQIQRHRNNRDADRRLKIGYVSPDFRNHPVGRFILPLLEAHDPAQVEIHCYSQFPGEDEITGRIRNHAHHWITTSSMTDAQLVEQIRRNQIDILIDLASHTGGNRLPIFAQKPAPIQATYLAYPGTTGLDTIDYRITDPFLDPPGFDDFYCEKSIRIETYWCYQPAIDNLPQTLPPCTQAGHITFGCLNNSFKISPESLQTWCSILAAVPNSRLHLHVRPGSHRDRIVEFLRSSNIDPNRLTFVPKLPLADYMNEYRHIDIALDPFPYVGGTTTCDALWMGVPVITLPGQTAVSRGGVSILSNIGLTEFMARDTTGYIRIATELAFDPPRLTSLRATMREKMRLSPLMNPNRFARAIENAYRQMWQNWIAS